MKKWKKVWMLLLCLLLAAVLPACGENQQPPEEDENVLIYAALNPVSEDFSITVKRFNLYHDDAKIEVRDYSDEGGMERLKTELALGQVPDIMEMHYLGGNADNAPSTLPFMDRQNEAWMPYRQMARKGYLEDLWPYIENDPDLGLDGVLMPPLKAAEVNGGLYMIFPEVSVTTLMGPELIVGSRNGWTLEELMETWSAMPEDATILRYNATRREMFSMLYAPLMEQFVDMEAGENTFDSQGFRDMIEFLDSFPEEFKTPLSEEGVRAELVDRILTGRQMLEATTLTALRYITYADLFFGTPVSFVGFPTADGSLGSFFNLHGSKLAMSSTCRNKDVAWEFMRKVLTKRYDAQSLEKVDESGEMRKIAVNLKNYDENVQFDLTDDRLFTMETVYLDGTPATFTGPLGEHLFELDMPNEDDLVRFEELINSTTRLYWPEDELSDIVWETLGAYFAGDRTLDDTIALLNNRVGVYLNEQK